MTVIRAAVARKRKQNNTQAVPFHARISIGARGLALGTALPSASTAWELLGLTEKLGRPRNNAKVCLQAGSLPFSIKSIERGRAGVGNLPRTASTRPTVNFV